MTQGLPAEIPAQKIGFDLDGIVAGLRDARSAWRRALHYRRETVGREFPSPEAVGRIVDRLRGALFPMRLGPQDLRQESEDFYVGYTLDAALQELLTQVRLELRFQARLKARQGAAEEAHPETAPGSADFAAEQHARSVAQAFANALPEVRALLDTDVRAAFEGDPAAGSVDEVLLCYPGIEAMIHYRLAHKLYRLGLPLLARLVAERAHGRTGIDIHPGASIGPGFFIDHGTGVVIGETAIIGARVRLYQAVTLGAKRFPVDEDGALKKGLERHPIVEADVVIYAGATILGRVTIGKGSTVGGNVWLTRSVPPGSHITQASSKEQAAELAA